MLESASPQPGADYPADEIVCDVLATYPGVTEIHLKVVWVQYIDGSTWGSADAQAYMMAQRGNAVQFLRELQAAYASGGQAAFQATLEKRNWYRANMRATMEPAEAQTAVRGRCWPAPCELAPGRHAVESSSDLLALRAAMLHWTQQRGIDPRQRLRIQAIVFFPALPINRTLRALATITSCPNSLSKRLIQGECVPISSATRPRGRPPNVACRAFTVVAILCSNTTAPLSSRTQYPLLRSPGSNPIVNLCCEKFLICLAATVLIFFSAGLLFICALSTSITWERTPHPVRRPAFSSHLLSIPGFRSLQN